LIDLDGVLEALAVERRAPDRRLLEQLFDAFNAKVPFESATKILRGHDRPAAGLLVAPEEFWDDFLEKGSGGTCFARVEGFCALATGLGFSPRKILGSVEKPGDHAALLIEAGGVPHLCDVGFPLPGVLGLEPGEGVLPLAEYRLEVGQGRARFEYLSGPRAGESVRFDLSEVSSAAFNERWQATFSAPSKFLDNVVLLKQEPHRAIRFYRGVVSVDDAHTRTRIPVSAPRAVKLERIFEISGDLLSRAFALAGDPEPESRAARIEAFLPDHRAEEMFRFVASPEGYLRFLAGVGEARLISEAPNGFTVGLCGPEGAEIAEEVSVAPDGRSLEVAREAGLRRTGFRVEDFRGISRIVRFAELPDAREEFLRSDAGRGRIAGLLAMDLLALSRLAAKG
jgi:N-acetyltransferase